MNIFFLSQDPVESAQLMCDKHVAGKMAVESAQMLSTAHRILDGHLLTPEQDSLLYKITHKNHPCSMWVRDSADNYLWLYRHFIALCDEYTLRYNKIHLSDTKFREMLKRPPANIPDIGPTDPPLAMPDEYKKTCPIDSYREYYIKEKHMKKNIVAYKNTPVPQFLSEYM